MGPINTQSFARILTFPICFTKQHVISYIFADFSEDGHNMCEAAREFAPNNAS